MEITVKNFAKALPKAIQKLAEKDVVRECDETSKGQFVAYVDEGSETFDVSLSLSLKGEVVATVCDCKNGERFCRHKTALLVHVSNGKQAKYTVKATAKKVSKAELLLDEADPLELKEWVRELIFKQKDIEIAFTHFFSAKQQNYTPEEVLRNTNDAVAALIKTKKKAEPTQVKKLVELWTDIHAPVVKNYLANVANENDFLNFHTLLNACLQFQNDSNTKVNFILKYTDSLLDQAVEPVNNLFDDKLWLQAVAFYLERLVGDQKHIRLHYVQYLGNLVLICKEERKNKLIDLLALQYAKNQKKYFSSKWSRNNIYTHSIFNIIDGQRLLSKYCDRFEPIDLDYGFNLKLIKQLIANNNLTLAEEYCKKQIQLNSRTEPNVPYLDLLKEIYAQCKNEESYLKVLSQVLP